MTVKKVGIPRGLMYYNYYPLWKEYFNRLGAEVIVSPKTNKHILGLGVKSALDETCLPVKLFYGHVNWLKDKVDYIFIPRLISVEKKEYICPKFMGLPDMIKANVNDLPSVIDTSLDMSKSEKNLAKFAKEVGKYFSNNPLKIVRAWNSALKLQAEFESLIISKQMFPPEAIDYLSNKSQRILESRDKGLNIAILGHGYNIYDEYISMNLIKKLAERRVNVFTADTLEANDINTEADKLPKKMFWTFGRKNIGGALHFVKEKKVDGIIHIASFGCGPDSLVGELIIRQTRKNSNIPILTLTIDEHTGEAGVVTRIEAFVDMLARRVAL
ncbi:MAG: acyl-CoA dehydratase activase-related protein [Bacillota bacterium]|nr:acyl-CoA dehydratase activase-related protein [Bacillota bacterium]